MEILIKKRIYQLFLFIKKIKSIMIYFKWMKNTMDKGCKLNVRDYTTKKSRSKWVMSNRSSASNFFAISLSLYVCSK